MSDAINLDEMFDDNDTIDRNSESGDKVTVTAVSIMCGYDVDKKLNKKHLTVGEVYTIERTVVHNWVTDVYLVEVPGVRFNSVTFDSYDAGKK